MAQPVTGVTVTVISSSSRLATTVMGRSPFSSRKALIQRGIAVAGTFLSLNEISSSLSLMPALAVGPSGTMEITVARTQRRPKASWENLRYLLGRLVGVAAKSPICGITRLSQNSRLAVVMR